MLERVRCVIKIEWRATYSQIGFLVHINFQRVVATYEYPLSNVKFSQIIRVRGVKILEK